VRLTVIGADAIRKRVVADINNAPELAWLKGKSVVNDYASTHWRIRDGGFVTPATADGVVIYAQAPDGKVLWRQDNYEGGAVAFAQALRDRVPGYDPNKDPSPKRPVPAPPPAPTGPTLGGMNLWWLTVPAALIFGILAAVRRKAVTPA
jgi:hypothetical protein